MGGMGMRVGPPQELVVENSKRQELVTPPYMQIAASRSRWSGSI